jgi:predicted metalloprotease
VRRLVLLASLCLAVPAALPASVNPDRLAATVVKELNVYWRDEFSAVGRRYARLPHLYAYSTRVRDACGWTVAYNASYCRRDHSISYDRRMLVRAARHGEFAAATILAHEFGHYVQDRLGWLTWAEKHRYWMGTELQADCYAGMFLRYAHSAALLEPGDLQSAMQLIVSVGENMPVKPRTRGAHGTSQQRLHWFTNGYTSGDLSTCDNVYRALYAAR